MPAAPPVPAGLVTVVGAPVSVLSGPHVGITGLAAATVGGPRGVVFAKWPTGERSRAPFQREAANLRSWPGPWPTGSPALRALVTDGDEPFAAFDHVAGTVSWDWSPQTVQQALSVLDELRALTPTGPLSRSGMVVPDVLSRAATAAGLPARLVADVEVFASDLHDRAEECCHGDAHPENWIIRPDGTPVLVDFEHAGGGPRGWDRAMLAALVPGETADRAAWATAHVARDRARVLVAVVAAKCVHRAGHRPGDRFALAAPGALALWESLAGLRA